MAEVYSQDVNVKANIQGLPKNSDALSKLTRAIGHNVGAIKGLTATLQKAGAKAVNAVNNTQGSTQKLTKPVQELEKAGSKAGAALSSLTSKMKEFGAKVKENWHSFKRLMGIMKSVVLVGGAVTAVFGAIVAVLATAQGKKRSATASHFMSPAKLDALKYTESTLKTDGQILQMLDHMGEAVLDTENYGAFNQLGIDPEVFRKLDAQGRFEYAKPILESLFQGRSDADISKNALVYEPFSKIAGVDSGFGRQLFGTRDASGVVHKGIAGDVSDRWRHWEKYTKKGDYAANAEASKEFNTALTSLQITFDTISAKAAPSITKALKALNKAFKKLEPTILNLIDALPSLIDKLSKFLETLGLYVTDSVSNTFTEAKGVEPKEQSVTDRLIHAIKTIAISTASGAGAGAVLGTFVPGVGNLVGAGVGAGLGALGASGKLISDVAVGDYYSPVKTTNVGVLAHVLTQKANLLVDKQEGNLDWYDPRRYSIDTATLKNNIGADLKYFFSQSLNKDPSVIKVDVKVEDHRIRTRVTDTSTNTVVYDQLVGGK